MSLSATPLLALFAGIALAAGLVNQVTPAGLLPQPDRPFAGYGNPAVRTEGRDYPRHAVGADDVRTSIELSPRRVVSQSSSIDEFLYSILPPERIVGVSETAYHVRVSNLLELTSRYKPAVAMNPEQVLRADPDLVLTPADARSDGPTLLRASGVPVYRMYTMFPTLASIQAHIRLVGYLTGEDARAETVGRRFEETIRRAAARKPAGAPSPRVMGFGGIYSYGSETLFNDILRVLGAENVAATHGLVGYDRVTDEHIVLWNPEWIVAGADRGLVSQVRARLLASPAIATTTAARRNQVVVFENHVFLPLSPFTAAFVEALAEALYGKAS